ncbi:MAPEG family protein [Kiloniella sp. EL199]|uniref:MAPEG family protein n=1 Tax=Kiloniella sp. EL199 TaxID=2107581 RepID=UPI000EA0DB84|nr:MAPEG family protein [Kiloniella sp. EL199]
MPFEFYILLSACLLALIHLASASFAFKAQVGHAYTIGARDENLKPEGIAGRLKRAQINFQETFPIFIALVFILNHIQGFDLISQWGAALYLVGRIVFLPLYAFGVVLYRTLAWKLATTGLALLGLSVFV